MAFKDESKSLCDIHKCLSKKRLIFSSESLAFSLFLFGVILHCHVVAWVLGTMLGVLT